MTMMEKREYFNFCLIVNIGTSKEAFYILFWWSNHNVVEKIMSRCTHWLVTLGVRGIPIWQIQMWIFQLQAEYKYLYILSKGEYFAQKRSMQMVTLATLVRTSCITGAKTSVGLGLRNADVNIDDIYLKFLLIWNFQWLIVCWGYDKHQCYRFHQRFKICFGYALKYLIGLKILDDISCSFT